METRPAGLEKLLHEHEAIRADLKRIDSSLGDLLKPPQLAENTNPERLKETINQLQTALKYVRDGVRKHINQDEAAFSSLINLTQMEQFKQEHRQIERTVDDAIRAVDRLAEEIPSRLEIERQGTEIRYAIHGLREQIETHTSREDDVIKQLTKGQ